MHVAHFVQRYPPALGGSEAYFARMGNYLSAAGDDVTVWTTTAVGLEEFWRRPSTMANSERPRRGGAPGNDRPYGGAVEPAVSRRGGEHPVTDAPDSPRVVRYPLLRFSARRYVLKALSLVPSRWVQCLAQPCNPVCPAMWRDAGRFDGPLDAVHATAFPYSWPIACGLRLARRRGVPFFLTPFLHLGDPTDPHDRTRRQYTRPHLRWLLRQADRVFVQTPGERDATVDLGVNADRVVLQGLGVDPADCTGGDRDAARRAWGVATDETVVGHLANASVEKGTVDLLRAAERAWAAGARFRVVLAGPEMANFRAFWATYPAQDRVLRLGPLTHAAKRDFYVGLDAFALPSRSDSFGLVLLEAWANGKPVVAYRAGGPGDLVRDGVDGFLPRCGDVDGLAAALTRLAADPKLRRRLGNGGLSRVGVEFRWADKLELVRETMREVVKETSPPVSTGGLAVTPG